MTKTLSRAKKSGGTLLEGKTFYLTQKVDVDKKLMRNVVAAHGGTVGVCNGFLLPRLMQVKFLATVTDSYIPHGDLKARPLCYLMRR